MTDNKTEETIVNRVAKSGLVTFDLDALYLEGERVALDISQWLLEGEVLAEKRFRESVKNYDFQQYEGKMLAIHCATGAIVPAWAFMLVASHAQPHAKFINMGSLDDLEVAIYRKVIAELDLSPYRDRRMIIAGCADRPVPEQAYVMITQALQPIVKSLFFGEACSSVPIYKKPKK